MWGDNMSAERKPVLYRYYYNREKRRLDWLRNRLIEIKEGQYMHTHIYETPDECLFQVNYNDGYSQVRFFFDIYVDDYVEITDWFRDDRRWSEYYPLVSEVDNMVFFEKTEEWLNKASIKLNHSVMRTLMNQDMDKRVKGKAGDLIYEFDKIFGLNVFCKLYEETGKNRIVCGQKKREYYCCYTHTANSREKGLKVIIYLSDKNTIAEIVTEEFEPNKFCFDTDEYVWTPYIAEDLMGDEIFTIKEDMTKKQKEIMRNKKKKQESEFLKNVLSSYGSLYEPSGTLDDNIIEKKTRLH